MLLNAFCRIYVRFWKVKQMAVNLDTFLINLVIHVIINAILLTGVLWISGRLLAGKDKAKFTDALWIAVLGTVVADVLGLFIVGVIATLIVLFVWIALIKHFFDCGWLKAIVIGVIAVLMLVVIALILGLLGIAILTMI
jgi:hypothetical protein